MASREIIALLAEGTRLWLSVLWLALVAGVGVVWLALRRRDAGRRFGGVLVFVAAACAIEALAPWAPDPLRGTMAAISLALASFAAVRAAIVSVDIVARRRRAAVSTIFRDLVTVLLYGVVVLVVLRWIGVDVTPLLTTSAIVTAVLGLALQETLGDVLGGVSLQLEKTFEPGDWVRCGDYLGRVQGIGWRGTRLVTRNLEQVEIPNAKLASEVIVNYRGRAVGDELFVGVSYATPPNLTKEVILGVLANNPEIARIPAAQVLVVDYGDSAIKYRIRFWMVDFSHQDRLRDEIMTALWYAFRRHGIEIPFPIRTLYMHEVKPAVADAEEVRREWTAALRQVDLLRELSAEDLAVLLPEMRETAFGDCEVVCREGEVGECLYVLRRGSVEIVARGVDGGETHVADLRAPAFFGEMSLLTGEPRAATVRAKGDVDLLLVDREGFEALFKSRPALAASMSRILADRQVELRERRAQVRMAESAESRSRRLLGRMQAIFHL